MISEDYEPGPRTRAAMNRYFGYYDSFTPDPWTPEKADASEKATGSSNYKKNLKIKAQPKAESQYPGPYQLVHEGRFATHKNRYN